jgi:uncharacterized membrane protein YbhN (UPF0104 family)
MRLGFWLKVAVSLALLAYVVSLSQPGRIVGALSHAHWGYVAVGTALWMLIQGLNVFKWWLLNRAQGLNTPYARLLDVYFIGAFFNMFLPSGFGGDAVRAYELSKLSGRAGTSVASVGVDRFTSLYALLLSATGALILAEPAWRVVPLWAVLALDVGGAAAFLLMLRGDWLAALGRWRGLARWPRVGAALAEMGEAMTALRGAGWVLAAAVGISLAYQLLAVLLHYLFMLALGLSVPMVYAAVFLPILTLAANLPLSINGLGVREGGFAYFLGRLGVDAGEAVSVGLLSLGMLLISAAWGALRYASVRKGRARSGEKSHELAS